MKDKIEKKTGEKKTGEKKTGEKKTGEKKNSGKNISIKPKKIKLIGDGSYGCVYYPGITCQGKFDNKRNISKLQIYNRASKNEIAISKYIQSNIKDYSKYFVIILQSCNINLNKMSEHKDKLHECKILTDNMDFKLHDKDKDKDTFVLTHSKYIKNKEIDIYLFSIELITIRIAEFINTIYKLFEGIKLLNDNKIIHYDLHSGNILFDLNRKIPLIIDFGIAIDVNNVISSENVIDYYKLKRATIKYSPEHYINPLELHLLTYVLSEYIYEISDYFNDIKLSQQKLDIFIDDMISNSKIIVSYISIKNTYEKIFKSDKNFKDLDISVYKKYVEEYYNSFLDKLYPSIVNKLVNHIYKIDQYMLIVNYSIILLKSIDKYIINYSNKININNYMNTSIISIYMFILDLLVYNLHPFPDNRMNMDEIQNIIDIIFSNKNKVKTIYDKLALIKFNDYFVKPDITIFQNKEILNKLEKITTNITI